MFKWAKTLQNWFEREQRDLPWRHQRTPYRVWIAEVMLQQTRAMVVVPYFLRWMEVFPNITALAEAPLEKVLKEWEGLGYYSRARHLHEAAKQILDRFGGEIPSSEKDLATLKGLGPYTRAAILSFAFHQKKAAVDGNVLRVIARLFAVEDPIDRKSTKERIQHLADSALPEDRPWEVAEGLIELGALICTKQPQCLGCPLKGDCLGFRKQIQQKIPVKQPKVPVTPLFRAVAILQHAQSFLVKKQPKGVIMGDLYEFPYFSFTDEKLSFHEVQNLAQKQFGLRLSFTRALPEVTHTFTRYRARLSPYLFLVSSPPSLVEEFEWFSLEELEKKPFSSGHKQIVAHLQQQ